MNCRRGRYPFGISGSWCEPAKGERRRNENTCSRDKAGEMSWRMPGESGIKPVEPATIIIGKAIIS